MTVRRSLALATIGNYATVLIAFLTNVIVARELTPAELGLFAISLAMTGLLDALREGGVNAYIIQHKTGGLNVLQSAFTAAVVLSALSAVLLFGAAPLAGEFFNASDIKWLLWTIGLGFLLYPFAATLMASLQREMRFRALLGIEVTASLVQSGVTLALLFTGFGVFSLAIAIVAAGAARAILSFWVIPDLKRFRINIAGMSSVLRFSAIATGSLILEQIKNGAFAVIAGRMIGPTPVGLADRSKALISLYDKVIAGMYPVLLPAFADFHLRSLGTFGGDL